MSETKSLESKALNPQINQPKKESKTSLAYKLAAAWMWHRLMLLLAVDLLLLFFIAVALFHFTEQNLAKTYVLWQNEPAAPHISGYTIESKLQPKGIIWPIYLQRLFPEITAQAYRSLDIHFDTNRFSQFKYQITMDTGSTFTQFSYDLSPALNWLGQAFILLLAAEGIIWAGGFFSGFRIARKSLRPLTDMITTAQTFNRHPPRDRNFHGRSERIKLDDLEGKINSINVEHLDTHLVVNSQELSGLAEAINAMLRRINDAYNQQSQFVSDASHELRTPIAVIQGYANLLDRWGKNDEKTLQESIDAIKSESEHMKDLVEQLLFLARSDNDTMVLNLETLDITAMLAEVFQETQMIDSGHRLSLIPGDSALVVADEGLIKQAIRILVDNAIKYTPPGGEIVLSSHLENGWAKITVQDQGIGIAGEDLPHVFDRFFRSEPSRTRSSGGTGLGLAIAKWIVEKHAGYFEVLSRPEIGTRFIAFLPLASGKGCEFNAN